MDKIMYCEIIIICGTLVFIGYMDQIKHKFKCERIGYVCL